VLEHVYQNLRNQFDVGCSVDTNNSLSDSTASIEHNTSPGSTTPIKSGKIEKEYKKGRF
jgi:hypothetical protein